MRELTAKRITEETAFAKIKEECGVSNEYGSAEIKFKIDNHALPSIRLGDLDSLIGAYDITNRLDVNQFEPSLVKAADWYYDCIHKEL